MSIERSKFMESTKYINLENFPTVPEALKARKEADIVNHQCIGLFISNPVQFVVKELARKNEDRFLLMSIFNYGYIMGVRAERARRKRGDNR